MIAKYKGQVIDYNSFLSFLSALGKMIAQSFGTRCEVAISDLDNTNRSVLAIYNGEVTGRKIGAPLNPNTRKRLQDGNGGISVNYRKNIKFNKKAIKSSTMVINAFGHNISFCINVDCSELETINAMLNNFLYMDEDRFDLIEKEIGPSPSVAIAVENEIAKLGKLNKTLTRSDRLIIIKSLQQAGIFHMKKSTTIVAESLGISRYTVYNYLRELSED